jgi:hypothetical protein
MGDIITDILSFHKKMKAHGIIYNLDPLEGVHHAIGYSQLKIVGGPVNQKVVFCDLFHIHFVYCYMFGLKADMIFFIGVQAIYVTEAV